VDEANKKGGWAGSLRLSAVQLNYDKKSLFLFPINFLFR
jgi:hypothetical protein